MLEAKAVPADALFRVFTACAADPRPLVIDVRGDKKKWDRGHVAGAYCIRVPSNGAALLDFSKNEYEVKWGQDCWWGKDVYAYGDAGLKRDHPVLAFLAKDGHAKSVSYFREGLEAFQKAYPFLVTSSQRASAATTRRYPSQLDTFLYLGDWSHAEAIERHAELGIKAVVTIHNNPGNLKLPPGKYSRLAIELADVDSADISSHLRPAYDFIEECRAAKKAVLVHCGAGVSRSATLCIAWLMRKNRWSAQKALEFARERRSAVAPNDGFWRTLCALEAQLGIAERSDADQFTGFHGADAKPAAEEPAGAVRVTFVPAGATSAPAGSKSEKVAPPAAPPAAPAAAPAANGRARDGEEGRRGERSRSRERRRSRSRSRDRRRRSRSRDGRRSRSRDCRRSRSRDRQRRDEQGPPPAAQQQLQEHAQQQPPPQEERVDVETTPGVVLEVVREGQHLGHLVLEMQRVSQEGTFGRHPSCDVLLEHLSISRAHAQLTANGAGGLFVTDLGSAHGTNVDGVWIKPKTAKPLKVGSVLKFGASTRELRVKKLPQALRK